MQGEFVTEAEERLVRKLDFMICPIFFLINFASILDRSSIGNAKIQGMDEDLGLNIGNRYNIVLVVSECKSRQTGKLFLEVFRDKTPLLMNQLKPTDLFRPLHTSRGSQQPTRKARPAVVLPVRTGIFLGFVLRDSVPRRDQRARNKKLSDKIWALTLS